MSRRDSYNDGDGCGLILLIGIALVFALVIGFFAETCTPSKCSEKRVFWGMPCGPGGKMVVKDGMTFCQCPDTATTK